MFEAQSAYQFRYCNSEKLTEDGLSRRRHVFVFISQYKKKYTFWADQFDSNIPFFGVKFFPSCLIKSNNKFKAVINHGDFIRILGTCFQIMIEMGNKFPCASFAYVAEPQRHGIYEKGLARIFSDIDYVFDHYDDDFNNNLYVISHRQLENLCPTYNEFIDDLLDHYGFIF